MKIDARYQYLNHHIAKVENVNIALNDKIDLYLEYLKDDAEFNSIEDMKSTLLDFMIEVRTQNNILHIASTDIKEFNRTIILGADINTQSIAFKKEMLKLRYYSHPISNYSKDCLTVFDSYFAKKQIALTQIF